MTGTILGTTADGMAIVGIVLGDGTAVGMAGVVHIMAGMAIEAVLTPDIVADQAIAVAIPVRAADGDAAMVAHIVVDLQDAEKRITAELSVTLHHV